MSLEVKYNLNQAWTSWKYLSLSLELLFLANYIARINALHDVCNRVCHNFVPQCTCQNVHVLGYNLKIFTYMSE